MEDVMSLWRTEVQVRDQLIHVTHFQCGLKVTTESKVEGVTHVRSFYPPSSWCNLLVEWICSELLTIVPPKTYPLQ